MYVFFKSHDALKYIRTGFLTELLIALTMQSGENFIMTISFKRFFLKSLIAFIQRTNETHKNDYVYVFEKCI